MPTVSELLSQNIGNTITNVQTWGGIIYNVKAYGAKGDGATDDTAAIIQAANALQSAGGGVLFFPKGTYRIFSTDYSTSLPTVNLGDFSSINGVSIVGYGATLNLDRVLNLQEYIVLFKFTTCTNISVEGFVSKSTEYGSGQRERGQRFIQSLGGSRNIFIRNVSVYGGIGLDVYAPSTAADTDRTKGITIENLYLQNIAYGINCRFSGDDLFGRGIVSNGVHRTYYIYGVRNHDVRIKSKNQDAGDCVLGGYEGKGIQDAKIHYENIDSDGAESAATCIAFGPGDENPVVYKNIDINMNIKYPSAGYPGHALYISKYDNTGALDVTDRGHIFENIRISGNVEGNPGGSSPILFRGTWGPGEYFRGWILENLVLTNTESTEIYLSSLKDVATIKNLVSTNNVYLEGNTSSRITVIGSKAVNLCRSTSDTSKIHYVNCEITSGSTQSYVNKTFHNTYINGVLATSGFRAYQSTVQSLAAATFTKIAYQTEVFDNLGEYDNTTYRFTAKDAGIYSISGSIGWAAGVDGNRLIVSIYLNGAETKRLFDFVMGGAANAVTSGSTVLKLAAGDYVEIFGYTANALDTVARIDQTSFEITRLA